MASIFEKTMRACLESKKTVAPKTANTNKKLVEKKVVSKKIKTESEEDDFEKFDDVQDDETMEFADDIAVVVDPNLDADEMTPVAKGFQDIIDDTPANEIPETDEYIDQQIYGCPICGQTFFSDKEMVDGDTCPVCGEEANGFVLGGIVVDADEAQGEDTSGEDKDDFDFDGEELDDVEVVGEPDEKDSKEDDEDLDESKKATKVRRERRTIRRPIRREGRIARKTMPRVRKVAESTLNLDEKSFNVYLNRFVRENYNNARSFNVVNARFQPKTRILTLEGVITFKSGKKSRANLVCKYNRASNIMMAKDNGIFKVESKKTPFIFNIRTVGNVIKCEGLKYDFKTSAIVEGKKTPVRVHSAPLTEGRSVVRRPTTRRTVEGRRIARRPARRMEATRRTLGRPATKMSAVEGRRIARKPLARRTVRTVEAKRRVIRRPATRTVEARRSIRRPSDRRNIR